MKKIFSSSFWEKMINLIQKQTMAFTDSEQKFNFKVRYWITINCMFAK